MWPVCTRVWCWNQNGAGAMTTVKNWVFIVILHENFYLVGRELIFGGGKN